MKINVIGGGPAGLYAAILLKQSDPSRDITVYERNRPDDTFGFGVVFSDETLGNFQDADAPSYFEILDNFAYWEEIDTYAHGERVRSTGHGFCGISRKTLLNVLQRRTESLDMKIHYQADITDITPYRDADLVVAADGINSLVRETFAHAFRPQFDWRPNQFIWLGSAAPLDAFTFIFKENDHGIWNVHAYWFEGDVATWIIETTDDTWRRAGMDKATEADSVRYLEALFKDELQGHPLLTNKSLWRNFPTIHCDSWCHENMVLLGDAAHTAHFSIGSGTKLAMEDSIALDRAMTEAGGDVAAALAAYDVDRREDVEKTQHAADVSLTWFEHVRRYWHMPPLQLAFSMLSRSKQITYDNLRLRDPALVGRVERMLVDQAREAGFNVPEDNRPPMFLPFRLGDMVLDNRVVVSPMCQYSAVDGMPDDWHLVHLGSRAIGGAGLVYTEMTNISEDGRISPGCTGLYNEAQRDAWGRIVDFVHSQSRAKICMQLGHAGRKGSTQLAWEEMDRPMAGGNWPLIAASPLPYYPESQTPRAVTEADMERLIAQYVQSARWAHEAGFDMIEIHMAHGYLLASFISPVTNQRDDGFGGDIAGRMRFPLMVFDAVRAAWPAGKPLAVRISATDWMEDGLSGADSVAVARLLKDHGCDLIDVSAGQTVPDQEPLYGRMFQTPFSDRIRNEVDIATIAVGNITTADQVNTIVAAGRADLVALARPHLADPYFTLRAAAQYGYAPQFWPNPYLSGQDQAMLLAEREGADMAELRLLARPPKPQHQGLAAD